MPSFLDLLDQYPYLVWLAVGGLFVLLNLITGFGRLMWPGVAAAAVAAVSLAGARMEPSVAVVIFAVLTAALLLLPRKLKNTPSAYVNGADEEAPPPRKGKRPVGQMDRTGRLVGRIGKTTSDFANGVGRVWIEGAEWSADLENGEFLSADTPVRVTRVNGGIRLQVRPLSA